MSTREQAPIGAPCWTDLWTSDVEGSRTFYCDLFGWEALEPSPEFDGYFMFTRQGVPVAGAMGAVGDMTPNDSWKIYLNTDDVARTLQRAGAEGAQITVPSMPVADLGSQGVLVDPTGTPVGAWQADTFPGFTVLAEHGAPSWFELYTRDHAEAVSFYSSVFRLQTTVVGDSAEFRYTTLNDCTGELELAGIMDAGAWLPEGVEPHWVTYWEVDDVDSAAAHVTTLGGSVQADPTDTPYGRMSKYLIGVGIALVALLGSMDAAGANPHAIFTFSATQVTLSIPAPSCRTIREAQACEWMLLVEERGVTGTSVIGTVVGTSGDLVVNYPAFCGEIQADALVRTPEHWHKIVGHQRTIATCSSGNHTVTPPPASSPVVNSQTNPGASGLGGSTLLTLPFTGTPVEALLVGGLFMVGVGVVLTSRRLMTWLLGD
jgi:hypothetical protein